MDGKKGGEGRDYVDFGRSRWQGVGSGAVINEGEIQGRVNVSVFGKPMGFPS